WPYLLRLLKRWLNAASDSFWADATWAASFFASAASVFTSPRRPSKACMRWLAASSACVFDAVRSDVSLSFDSVPSTRWVRRVSDVPTCSRTKPFVAHAVVTSMPRPPQMMVAASCRVFIEPHLLKTASHDDQAPYAP